MKNLGNWIAAGIVICVGAMGAFHALELKEAARRVSEVKALAERGSVASEMKVRLERYRRAAASFRKLSPAEIAGLRNDLREAMSRTVSRLEQLEPSPGEQAAGARLNDRMAELLSQSIRLDPQLFSKDAYQKEPVRELHDGMISDLGAIAEGARERLDALTAAGVSPATSRLMRASAAASAMAALLILLLLARSYLVHGRPLARLRARAVAVRGGKLLPPNPRKLRGAHGEIQSVIDELALTVDAQRKERHHFVTAVASDLRAPLVQLQAGAAALAGDTTAADPALREQAGEAVRRSLFRLSRSLDDLTDIVDLDRSEMRLDEKIVDIRETVAEVGRVMGGTHGIRLSLPPMPIWTLVDVPRLERVMVNLVSKMAHYLPQGGEIGISMQYFPRGPFRGVEILVQDGERLAAGKIAAAGPEQDILRHWVSENGFGMALAQKILRAHGGAVTASGVAGAGVAFTVRIPQERVASGLMTSSVAQGRGGEAADSVAARAAGALEGARIKPMLA